LAESRVRALVDLANDRGGVDNITVLLVDILPRGASQAAIDTAPTRSVPVVPENG
jgi:serine/threonine protein phosphatase PrpC